MKQTTIRFRFVGIGVFLAVLLMMGAVTAASAQQASSLVRVIADDDCDGTLNGFENPLANWNVFVDENENGERDDEEPTQVSGGDGYAFLTVDPGTGLGKVADGTPVSTKFGLRKYGSNTHDFLPFERFV